MLCWRWAVGTMAATAHLLWRGDVGLLNAFVGLWGIVTAPVFGFAGLAYGIDAWAKQTIPAQQAGAP